MSISALRALSFVFAGAAALTCETPAFASPITYALTLPPGSVGGGSLGGHSFSSAATISITFTSDTQGVQAWGPIQGHSGFINLSGTCSIKVSDTNGAVYTGQFLPAAAIYVGVDIFRGSDGRTYEGISFGSNGAVPNASTFPQMQVAYPFAFSEATQHPYDLKSATDLTGIGFSLWAFPKAILPYTPPNLPTTAGDLLLPNGEIAGGTWTAHFTAVLGP